MSQTLQTWRRLNGSATLSKRVLILTLEYGDEIIDEDAATPKHAERLAWALRMFVKPDAVVQVIMRSIIFDAAVDAAEEQVSDADLRTATRKAIRRIAFVVT